MKMLIAAMCAVLILAHPGTWPSSVALLPLLSARTLHATCRLLYFQRIPYQSLHRSPLTSLSIVQEAHVYICVNGSKCSAEKQAAAQRLSGMDPLILHYICCRLDKAICRSDQYRPLSLPEGHHFLQKNDRSDPWQYGMQVTTELQAHHYLRWQKTQSGRVKTRIPGVLQD